MTKQEAYLLLRRLVNPDPVKAASPGLKYDTHVDYYAASSPIEASRCVRSSSLVCNSSIFC